MKKVLLLVTVLAAGSVFAQDSKDEKFEIEKGSWNLGGDLSFRFADSDESTQTRFSESENSSIAVFPNVGYAVGKNLITGLSLGYGYSKTESLNAQDGFEEFRGSGDRHTWTIAPYVRKFFPIGKKAAFYAQAEAGYSRSKAENEDDNTNLTLNETTSKTYFFGLRPGLSYFVSNSLALETRLGFLGYTKTDVDFESDTGTPEGSASTDSIEFSLDSSNIFFGLTYYF